MYTIIVTVNYRHAFIYVLGCDEPGFVIHLKYDVIKYALFEIDNMF